MAQNAKTNPVIGEMRSDSRTSFVFERGRCTLGSSAYMTRETQSIDQTSV